MTIADFCLVATAESLIENAPLVPSEHSKTIEWIERMSKLSYYEELNSTGARDLQSIVRSKVMENAENADE